MYKVYKSVEVVMGNKKKLQYKDNNIFKINSQNIEEVINECKHAKEIARQQSKQILEEADLRRTEIITNAKNEAALIIEEAYEDSKKIYENAKAEAYKEGIVKGEHKGYQEFQQLLKEATEIKKEIIQTKKRLAKELEEEIVDLVIFSIKKVIDFELEGNHEILLNLIKKGLEKCTFTETLIIRVSENDFDMLTSYKNRIFMMTEGIDDIQIKKDAALSKGSVIIETLSGKIDASVDVQINQIEALFKELFKSEVNHGENNAQ